MRTVTDHKSLGWVGANPSKWVGAVNPIPNDFPIGTFTLALTNVVVGSAIQIEASDGSASLYNGTAGATSVTLSLSCYAPVSPRSSLRIKVRKGTASPFYQPYETLTTAVVGSASIYVSQIPDE